MDESSLVPFIPDLSSKQYIENLNAICQIDRQELRMMIIRIVMMPDWQIGTIDITNRRVSSPTQRLGE